MRQPSVQQKLTILGFFDINVFDNIVGLLSKEEAIEVYQLDEKNNGGRWGGPMIFLIFSNTFGIFQFQLVGNSDDI